MASIGCILQASRKVRGLSLSALAAAAGVHKATLSRWERDKAVPFAYELSRVLDALNLSAKERQACYQCLEAPRSVHLAHAGATSALPISSGELLRALRHRSGLSQSAIACVARVTQVLVVKWERGECWPSSQHLHAFCFAVGATEEELVFLTTRAWRYVDPLPLDKDALDAVIWRLENYDTTTTRAATYLALTARYHALFRAGKVSEVEATGVYGTYAYYLAWRLGRFREPGRVAAPVLAGLGRSRGLLTFGQIEAVTLQTLYGDKFGEGDGGVGRVSLEEKRALLDSIASRLPPGRRAWYMDMIATAWGNAGHIEEATTYFERSIVEASSAQDAAIRRDRFIQLLCRHGRFRQAASLLMPTPVNERRVVIKAANLFYHAQVLAGLGEYSEAGQYLSRAVTYTRQHSVTQFDGEATRLARAIARGRTGQVGRSG